MAHKFDSFILGETDASKAGIIPASVHTSGELTVCLAAGRGKCREKVVAFGKADSDFSGEKYMLGDIYVTVGDEDSANAKVLRSLFPFTAPVPVLRRERSFGVGDRLGIAADGHIKVFERYPDVYPVLAQQSMRELTLTNRTYADVLDAASWAVFRADFTRGFGADGDHLKRAEDVLGALELGYSMITLDCSEHIVGDPDMSAVTVPDEIAARYAGKTFDIGEGKELSFTAESLAYIYAVYGEMIDFAAKIYHDYFADGRFAADFELSIDETATPTDPCAHFFVANELDLRGVKPATVAPRFCGEFQKGVDYIGDLAQFEYELGYHAVIARKFGYKLSIHSGSDKFSAFPIIGKLTEHVFHVKTAGTNWLEAMRVVAKCDPALYREVHGFALEAFDEASQYYHVTTDLGKIAPLSTLTDAELPELFNQNDARQLIHITYGLILSAKDEKGKPLFKTRLYDLWRKYSAEYADALIAHIGHHIDLLSL